MSQCLVFGCNSPVCCKQMCNAHYKRMRRTGRIDRVIREDGAGTLRGGYFYVMIDGERKSQHTFIAEKALGKKLPAGVEVHHVDGNRLNNTNNLVICQDRSYHQLLHKRQRALEACGNADWEKCYICKEYDSVQNLKGIRKGGSKYHRGSMRGICNSNRCQHG